MKVNNNIIQENRLFLIAEAGVNYYDIAKKEGISNVAAAKLMVREAALAGAHAIKFQIYKAGKIASKYSPSYWDTTKEPITSQYELFKKFDTTTNEDWEEIAKYAKKNNIVFMATPFDHEAVELVDKLSPIFKVASADITNFPMLRLIAKKGKPIVISTGASTKKEIAEAIGVIEKEGNKKIILLHCVLNYPTKYEKANLFKIPQMQKLFPNYAIGYSDHTFPDDKMLVLTTAYLLGARVIEKHFTLDKTIKGNDHFHSMDQVDLKKFIDNIRFFNTIFGDSRITEEKYLKNEAMAIKNARRSIVASRDLKKGEKLTLDTIMIKRPGVGISPKFINQVIGKQLKKGIKEDRPLQWHYFN